MKLAIVYVFHFEFFPASKVLVSTGYAWNSGTETEVIDSENSNVTCKDLEDFPMELEYGVGANLASMPIICGGLHYEMRSTSSDKCFIYKEGGWQHFVTLINGRQYAAGIVYENTFHIFGGYDSESIGWQRSSEIVNEDGSSIKGPKLPIPIVFPAIASINSTVSIITGGWTDADLYSDKTWYFNHATQKFHVGPNLLEGRRYHSSGTITDKETKEQTVIVAGGDNGSIMDSTEMLLNGKWVTGKNHNGFVHFW